MKAKCIENSMNNTNFTEGKEYEMNKEGLRSDCAGMWVHFKDFNKPTDYSTGSIFNFGMCKFQIIN